jgi:hypothetical protein
MAAARLALSLCVALGAFGCTAGPGTGGSDGDSAAAPATPGATAPVAGDGTQTPNTGTPGGKAYVESVEVMLLESFPLQVRVAIGGQLSDACTTLGEPAARRDGDTFHVELPTYRADGMCAQVLVPFATSLALDVEGLPKGTYAVVAGDQRATFTFERDNRSPR